MKARIPKKGKTLADKMFVNRARSEQDWVMSGVHLGIRLAMCAEIRAHGFGSERLKRTYREVNNLWFEEIQPDVELGEARMAEMLDKRLGKNWENEIL